jgi:hypothetical protein
LLVGSQAPHASPSVKGSVNVKTLRCLEAVARDRGREILIFYINVDIQGKAIPVTGRGGHRVVETSRLPHFLHNRLTDGVEAVSLTHRPLHYPQENSWYSFLLEAESTTGP